ncbi:hypothetical protein CDL12_03820 [Handroanthus impetiginosus]|uniref:Uncharacterized protein n=1 Tax=Handroanthus impetiginosus TaxID=429701 RepID=A0A2G9I121_9LAMI|nr:hypothetical protein CDL12_03820 [Handroanthus impetiginosus]
MSCIQITACQLSCSPSAFPAWAFQLNKASTFTSTYLGAKLPKTPLKLTSGASRYQQCAIVCLFGGKGKSENGNEDSPWKAIEKVLGNFRKDQSIEDALRQQIQKQEYVDDGGSGGKGPGGGGGGGGSGEAEDEDPRDEFVQVMMATLALISLYTYIIRPQFCKSLVEDLIQLVFKRQVSFRQRQFMDKLKRVFEKKRVEDDPYWLERAIINTPTWFDHPIKYKLLKKAQRRQQRLQQQQQQQLSI